MPQCLRAVDTFTCSNGSGTTCVKVPVRVYVPDGSASSVTLCRELLVITQSEYEMFVANPFRLTPEEGLLVSGAIAAAWAAAWAWRALARTLQSDGAPEEGS